MVKIEKVKLEEVIPQTRWAKMYHSPQKYTVNVLRVSGDTFPLRKILKANGFQYIKNTKVWEKQYSTELEESLKKFIN